LNFKFSPGDHHALEKIYMTKIAAGQVEAVK
jgi:hypothetical protein